MFIREHYYTQTEACKKFKISVKAFKSIVNDNTLEVILKPTILHTEIEGLPYNVNAIYIGVKDFDGAIEKYKQQQH